MIKLLFLVLIIYSSFSFAKISECGWYQFNGMMSDNRIFINKDTQSEFQIKLNSVNLKILMMEFNNLSISGEIHLVRIDHTKFDADKTKKINIISTDLLSNNLNNLTLMKSEKCN